MSDSNDSSNRLASRSTTTTIAFPILLLDKITEISREWAVSLGFSPNGNRNRWIIGVLKRAVDGGINPIVEATREDIGESIHKSTRKLVNSWNPWDNLEREEKEVFYQMAEKVMEDFTINRKEKGEK
jgi:hypothetical protein